MSTGSYDDDALQDDASAPADPPTEATDRPVPDRPIRGTMRNQQPGTTVPRRPTVAEARARDKARQARQVAEEFARAQAEQRENGARQRRRVLMGSVAVVGVVGLVALSYSLRSGEGGGDAITATCVADGTNEVVPDSYCSAGSPGMGGLFLFAGAPYRYYYGGANGGVGSVANGGTLEAPRNAPARTRSGSTVNRGGFGSPSVGGSSSVGG